MSTSEQPHPLEAAGIRWACGFLCGFRITGCPGGCYFCPRLESCGTFFCVGAPRANVPDPLFKFFSAWSEWKRPFKCSKCPRGIITPGKEKGCVIHAILLVLMTLHAQRG